MKILFVLFSILLLVYLIWPSPFSVTEFNPLPNSVKSTLDGDTVQVPNVSAFFANTFRTENVSFYKKNYQQLSNFFFPPLKLNHPPEYAFTAVKKYTDSTYLEELVYPLRDSLYVNGFEPFYEDGQPRFWGATKFSVGDNSWLTKITLRFYPSPLWSRVVVWFGISVSVFLLWIMTKRILRND